MQNLRKIGGDSYQDISLIRVSSYICQINITSCLFSGLFCNLRQNLIQLLLLSNLKGLKIGHTFFSSPTNETCCQLLDRISLISSAMKLSMIILFPYANSNESHNSGIKTEPVTG